LIVGYGNPLRGDDGVGPVVARAFVGVPGIDAVCCHQLTPELAERLAAVDLAVFVDASVGVLAGSVGVVRLGAGAAGQGALVHHVDPAKLLALAGRLYGCAPVAFLVTIGAASTELGEGLSQSVAAAVPDVVAAILALLTEHAG
jgi:hydrogenase maturation protease